MVRRGKEPADDDSSPDQREAPESVPDPRSLNGINRQLQPDRRALPASGCLGRCCGEAQGWSHVGC